jgi:serpin B
MRNIAAVTALMLAVVSCGGEQASVAEAEPGEPQAVSPAEVDELVAGNDVFAFDLFRSLAKGDNLIISPHSIATALTMTYAGARGSTAEEMKAALGITLDDEILHAARGALVRELLAEPEQTGEDEGEPFELEIANTLWAQNGYPFLDEFLETLATDYQAGMNLVDFVNAAEEARQAINASVEEQTRGRITDLIPPGVLDQLTRLVLVNAIWFKGTWEEEFPPDATRDAAFTLLDGTQVQVPMMNGGLETRYLDGDGYQVVWLPYIGGASMVVIVPDVGRFDEVVGELDPEQVRTDSARAATGLVVLALPRFEFRTQLELSRVLEVLGMESAFLPPPGEGTADFSGMTGEPELFVSAVIHDAFVSVDEEGTEAAAATAVVMEGTGAPVELANLTVDRPFLFLIQHDSSGEILFLGQVTDPRS